MRGLVSTGVLAAAVALAAAGATASPTAKGMDGPAPAAKSGAKGAKVKLLRTRFGRILVTGKGLTLYLFDKEKTAQSECYDDCAVAWPPLLTRGKPVASRDVKQKLLRTTTRTDGRRQVTYKGHPLYRYHTEDQAGEVLCQNVFEFGGLWLVVDRFGRAIR
jgi:predicted lipoprotein with Yx(FWY)xxD motif